MVRPVILYNELMRNPLLLACCLLTLTAGDLLAENDHVRIARENSPAIVAINTLRDDGSTFTATGFIITPDGLLATSRHVAENTVFINVTFQDGTISGEAVPLALAGNVDIALLKIQAQSLPTLKIGDSSTVQPGQPITVIGNPRRLQNTITSGIISQIRQKADGVIWHQISAPISPSSSGSPIFNDKGEVISIAFASYPGENNQNLNFAVPSAYLLELIQKAGFSLPAPTQEEQAPAPAKSVNPVLAYLQRCWDTLVGLFHTQDPNVK